MGAFLFLPALLGLAALATAGVTVEQRKNGLRIVGMAGTLAALTLLLLGDGPAVWREVRLASGIVPVIAAAGAVSFLVCVALVRRRFEIVAAAGIAASALALAAGSRWAAPFLIFWLASSAALALGWRKRPQALVALALSDLCLVGAVALGALEGETWQLASELDGWGGSLLVAAALIRIGAVPGVGVWEALRGSEAALLPLAVSGGFVISMKWTLPATGWVGLALLASAVICGFLLASRPQRRRSVAGCWASTSMAAVAVAAATPQPRAALAACLAVGAVAVWGRSQGRAEAERGYVLSFVLGTTAFGSIAAAASLAFSTATSGDASSDRIPALASLIVLSLLLGVGVLVGSALGAAREAEDYSPSPVIATWALFAATVFLGLTPSAEIGLGDNTRTLVLMTAAVIAAAAAVLWSRRRPHAVVLGPRTTAAPGVPKTPRPVALGLRAAAGVIAAVTVGATILFVVAGLRAGFL